MKYPIVIPSRGRAQEVITLDRMPVELHPHVHLFTLEEESKAYFDRYGDTGTHILCSSTKADRISKKRQKMAQWVREETGAPYFWMMDDDLTFFEKYEEGGRLWMMDTADEFEAMFTSTEDMMDAEPDRFCAIGISLRQGNNQLDWPYVDNVRLIRCGLFNTEAFLGCEHNRIDFMGDFDVMLQMLRAGYDNRVRSDYAQDQRATNAVGGCETSRTAEVMDRVAEELAALHDPFVKTKMKKNKTGPLAERKDVTIYWKKARASADA